MQSILRLATARSYRLAALLGIVLAAVPARATVVVSMDVEQLAAAATAVVHGTVLDTRAEDDHGRVFTRVEVKVREQLKGPAATAPDRVAMRVVGGSLGGYSQVVPGAPQLTVGDEVVLFLWSPGPGQPYRPLGLAMGTFHVERRGKVVEAVSRRDGLASARADDPGHPDLADERLPLTSLLQRVRAVGGGR